MTGERRSSWIEALQPLYIMQYLAGRIGQDAHAGLAVNCRVQLDTRRERPVVEGKATRHQVLSWERVGCGALYTQTVLECTAHLNPNIVACEGKGKDDGARD